MDTLYLAGRPVRGFALGDDSPTAPAGAGVVTAAAVMAGAAAGLLAHVLRAPLWGSLLGAAGAALATKVAIDRVGGEA